MSEEHNYTVPIVWLTKDGVATVNRGNAEPCVRVNLSLLDSNGRSTGPQISTHALLDTGADTNMIGDEAIERLKAQPFRTGNFQGNLDRLVDIPMYRLALAFPDTPHVFRTDFGRYVKPISAVPPFNAILGRLVLSNFRLVLDGITNQDELIIPAFSGGRPQAPDRIGISVG